MFIGYFDGGSVGNPAIGAIGAYLKDTKGNIIWETSKIVGLKTSIEAEYEALIALLHEIGFRGLKRVKIYGDSEVVINQVNSSHKVRQLSSTYRLCAEAQKLMVNRDITLKWIPRHKNTYSDHLCREAYKSISSQINLFPLTESIYLALDKEQYAVDIFHKACTCPSFKENGTCLHLDLALKQNTSKRSA